MYKIIIQRTYTDRMKTYVEQFFKTEKEAKRFARILAKSTCCNACSSSDLKYVLRFGSEKDSFVAMIATPEKFFYTPIEKYYVEKVDDIEALTCLFKSILSRIDSIYATYYPGVSDNEEYLSCFEHDVRKMIAPYLYCPDSVYDIDIGSDVEFWICTYKNEYAGTRLIRECCEFMVYFFFAIIDGLSPKNHFQAIETVFGEELQTMKFNSLWKEYLGNNK